LHCQRWYHAVYMPERHRGRDPNRHERRSLLPEYRHAVRFPDEPSSNTAYEQTRDIIRDEPCDLSLYRTALLPALTWYVIILGQIPEEDLQERIYEALEGGEAVSLPEEVWRQFNQRRLEQSGKGPWVEKRYGRRTR
jgi:hypothetical protein